MNKFYKVLGIDDKHVKDEYLLGYTSNKKENIKEQKKNGWKEKNLRYIPIIRQSLEESQ